MVLFQRTDLSGPAAARDYEVMQGECIAHEFDVVGELIGDRYRWAAPISALIAECVTSSADGVLTPSLDHLETGLVVVSTAAYVMTVQPRRLWVRGKVVSWP